MIHAPKPGDVVKVVRDSMTLNINSEEIVIDDIIMLSTGKQIQRRH